VAHLVEILHGVEERLCGLATGDRPPLRVVLRGVFGMVLQAFICHRATTRSTTSGLWVSGATSSMGGSPAACFPRWCTWGRGRRSAPVNLARWLTASHLKYAALFSRSYATTSCMLCTYSACLASWWSMSFRVWK
jgi:hypothetical protein